MRTTDRPAWIALGIVYLVWGSVYIGIRFTITSMPLLLSAGFRFLFAGLILSVILLLFGKPIWRISWVEFGTAVLSGLLLLSLGNGLVTIAQQYVASGLVALLIASVPLQVVLLRLLIGERPSRATYMGVAVGLTGLVILLLGGSSEGTRGTAWWGVWLVLLAALSWACGSLAGARLPKPSNPFVLSAVSMLAGGALLTISGFVAGEQIHLYEITATSWWAWSYLVIFGSLVAFSAYTFVLGRLPVSTAATHTYVNPVVAVALGTLLADERFRAPQLIGGALVLVAVALVIRAERRPAQDQLVEHTEGKSTR